MIDYNENFDVVDSNNNVIGQAPRSEAHKNNLMHRSVHILVFNSVGDLFLQKRAITKDENPGLWDSSAAGHVNSGEGYLQCAERELNEELRISSKLNYITKIRAQPDTLWEHVQVFKCQTDKIIKINTHEIIEGCFWQIKKIMRSIKSNPILFTPTFQLIFNNYFYKGR